MAATGARLLLVTHVPILTDGGSPQIDDQTAAGIVQWCKYFGEVTFYGVSGNGDDSQQSSTTWVTLPDELKDRCTLRVLPRAYGLYPMLKAYRGARAHLRREIKSHTHLCFTIGTLRGDWPSVAAIEAIIARRKYSAWIDRVETQVKREQLKTLPRPRAFAAAAALPAISLAIRILLRRSSLALLQGGDCYGAYARFCRQPFCTYDTHTTLADEISEDELSGRCSRVMRGFPLKILYVGRAVSMKGAQDWIEALVRLDQAGVLFDASWIGDGPELASMREVVAATGMSDKIHLPGFEGDRSKILDSMRDSDVFLFCHKTYESPRCLIESLVSGCPLVGYESPYAQGLIDEFGGGTFVPRHDVAALTDRVITLHHDRIALANLIREAARSGRLYNEDEVYRYRAELIRSVGI